MTHTLATDIAFAAPYPAADAAGVVAGVDGRTDSRSIMCW